MNLKFNDDAQHTINRFSRLGTWYILALSVIASVAIMGQVLIQLHLKDQLSDSRVVNLAGSQRYKSQWIVKMSLLLYGDTPHSQYPQKIETLERLLSEWKRGHNGLQYGDEGLELPGHNSPKIMTMFKELDPYFQRVYSSASVVIKLKKEKSPDTAALHRAIKTLLDNEAVFLSKMDQVVYQYDYEARLKVARLSKMEYSLLIISVVVILLEIIFIFRPTAVQVNKTVNQLIASEKNAKKLTKEIGELYGSLEKSYEQLSQVNLPVENPKLYAKADRGGNIIFITDLFTELTGIASISPMMRISDLFYKSSLGDDWMDTIIERSAEGDMWQGEIHFQNIKHKEIWSDVVIIPVYKNNTEIDELVVLGTDITLRKQAESTMRQKNRAEIEKKINQQKFRSVLILEGQEEERKRIAMDIHDGIGQMLTSLKFQIESIDNKNEREANEKISEIKQGIKDVIKEVRKVTFNLKPTVLGDYGLQAALNVFVKEIGKLTETTLEFKAEGDMNYRIPQKVENNIFRIVQEAINNGIKYSKAKRIEVVLRQTENDLVITVRDEGEGFDQKLIEARNVNIESGRGFFNMYERTEYINGQLDIQSAPGQGTTVTLVVPLHTPAAVEA